MKNQKLKALNAARMNKKIKKGDRVVVITGKDRGKSGKVLKLIPEKARVIVEGINLAKKHLRKRSESEPGGIKDIPASVHISNLALFCSNCNKRTKAGLKILEDKSKIRICRRCQQPI